MLSAHQERFAQEVTKGATYAEAYRIAYGAESNGKGDGWAVSTAWRLARLPHVWARIKELRAAAATRAVMQAADVMNEWVDIATASAGDIVHFRRVPCRHCYGLDHKYQWRISEYADAVAEVQAFNTTAPEGRKKPMPPLKGGMGYSRDRYPHPDCPNCDGEGEGDIYVVDTRMLTGKAAKLYAGVKQTRTGFEVLFRDQDAALANIARSLGMLAERQRGDDDATAAANAPAFLRELAKLLPD